MTFIGVFDFMILVSKKILNKRMDMMVKNAQQYLIYRLLEFDC
ncbi:unnamed protein product [Paramecium octaurelia]|uniref:Uncharacterized protein n=1 Tax=Paramecium octaurelia TaxID=43137 RepID=A0A8S1WF12_PAROT|nr:unnamed protein product [Paramecium octaurelia]